jgi:hypothetical protein
MYLVQVLLPLADNDGNEFPEDALHGIQAELHKLFGGLTAYTRAPARGSWTHGGAEHKDDIVVIEVMAETLDKGWWRNFRKRLEKFLHQKKVVIRAQKIIAL